MLRVSGLIHTAALRVELASPGNRSRRHPATVNAVISKRFAKKQQMQWSKTGAHLLLQTRTQTLAGPPVMVAAMETRRQTREHPRGNVRRILTRLSRNS